MLCVILVFFSFLCLLEKIRIIPKILTKNKQLANDAETTKNKEEKEKEKEKEKKDTGTRKKRPSGKPVSKKNIVKQNTKGKGKGKQTELNKKRKEKINILLQALKAEENAIREENELLKQENTTLHVEYCKNNEDKFVTTFDIYATFTAALGDNGGSVNDESKDDELDIREEMTCTVSFWINRNYLNDSKNTKRKHKFNKTIFEAPEKIDRQNNHHYKEVVLQGFICQVLDKSSNNKNNKEEKELESKTDDIDDEKKMEEIKTRKENIKYKIKFVDCTHINGKNDAHKTLLRLICDKNCNTLKHATIDFCDLTEIKYIKDQLEEMKKRTKKR